MRLYLEHTPYLRAHFENARHEVLESPGRAEFTIWGRLFGPPAPARQCFGPGMLGAALTADPTYAQRLVESAGLSWRAPLPASEAFDLELFTNGTEALHAAILLPHDTMLPATHMRVLMPNTKPAILEASYDLAERERVRLHLMTGPVVPSGMGHILIPLQRSLHLWKRLVEPLERPLRNLDFRGVLRARLRLSTHEASIDAITTIPGPTLCTHAELLECSLLDLLRACIEGRSFTPALRNEMAGSLHLLSFAQILELAPASPEARRHLWLNGSTIWGHDIGWATASAGPLNRASSLRQLRRRLYRTALELLQHHPDALLRPDIGLQSGRGLQLLRSWEHTAQSHAPAHTPEPASLPTDSPAAHT